MEIQCRIELLASGMEMGQVFGVSLAESLEALRAFRKAWRSLPTGSNSEDWTLKQCFSMYKDLGFFQQGIVMHLDVLNERWCFDRLPSTLRRIPSHRWSFPRNPHEGDLSNIRIVLDSASDLLVMVCRMGV